MVNVGWWQEINVDKTPLLKWWVAEVWGVYTCNNTSTFQLRIAPWEEKSDTIVMEISAGTEVKILHTIETFTGRIAVFEYPIHWKPTQVWYPAKLFTEFFTKTST